MSLSRTRPLVAAVLLTVLVAGCGGDKPAADVQPTSTAPSTSEPAKPSEPATPPAPKGIDGLPAKTILARSRAAAQAVTSIRIRASFTEEGERVGMDVGVAPSGLSGSFTLPGGRIELIKLGKTLYAKPSEKFLRSQAKSRAEGNAVVAAMNGRWLMTKKPDPEVRAMLDSADPATLFKELLQPTGAVRKTGPRTVDGVRSIGLRDKEGVLWVDVVTALPVRLENSTDKSNYFAFSQYGKVPAPKAPPKSQTIDQQALEG